MTPTGERVEPKLPLDEILDHVIAGHRVAIVDVLRRDALERLGEVAALARERQLINVITLTSTHGREHLRHPSGGQLVAGHVHNFHGHTLDVAYVAAALRQDLGKLERLVPALAPTNGEIVWWER